MYSCVSHRAANLQQFFNVFRTKKNFLCTFAVGVRSGLQKDQSSICGEFWVRACEPAGLSCICMQLKTFGPNEQVTLGACGRHSCRLFNFVLHHQLRLRFTTHFSKLHQHISVPPMLPDAVGFYCFFFFSYFQRDVTLARPGKDHPSTNLLPIKLFTSDTDRLALRKTASYTGCHFSNTESVQLAAWAEERNYWNCCFCCSATWATVF